MKFKIGQLVKRNDKIKAFQRMALKHPNIFIDVGTVSKHALEVDRNGFVDTYTYVRWPDGLQYSYKEHELKELFEPNDVLKDIL